MYPQISFSVSSEFGEQLDMKIIWFAIFIATSTLGMNVTSRAKYNTGNIKQFKNDTTENNSVNYNNYDMIETSCHVMTEELKATAKVSVSSALENLCNYSKYSYTIVL